MNEVAEVIRLSITPAEAKALREWAAKNLLPKPKARNGSRGRRLRGKPLRRARGRTGPLNEVT